MHDSNEPKEARAQASIEQSQAAQDNDNSSPYPSRRATQVPALATLAVAFFAAPPDLLKILEVMGGKH
jgi:hypothetical protein